MSQHPTGASEPFLPMYTSDPSAMPPSESATHASSPTRAARRSGRKRSKAAGCLVWFANSAMFTCLLIAFILAPLAVIIIGALNTDMCPVEPMIPIWLIVFGSAFLLLIFVLLFAQVAARQKRSLILSRAGRQRGRGLYVGSHQNEEVVVGCEIVFCLALICMFLLGWFFFGNMWLFMNWRSVEQDLLEADSSSDRDPKTDPGDLSCNFFLFFFTFAVIVLVYGFIAVPFCFFCIVLCHSLINS